MEKLHSNPRWQQLQQDFFATGDAAPVLAGITALTEEIALDAYRASLAPILPDGVSILAVGGFGRRELFPYSDVDILILVERESQTIGLKEALAEFVRLLWDAGLRLSQSVRTITECTEVHEQNIELNISLLDRRLLGGSAEVYAKLERKLPDFLARQSRTLARHLCRLARARHGKFQNTFYHLEPDVKEAPGGLRDLHMIHWLRKLSKADGPSFRPGPAKFLHTLRCFLHYQACRDHNLLNFDAQEAITGQPFATAREPADFMREYFQNARAIYSEARRALDASEKSEVSLLSQFRDWRSRLSNADFTVLRERVFLRTPAQLESDPALILRLFEFVARHGIPLSAETERRLEDSRATFSAWCAAQPALWPPLRNILTLPYAAAALRAMHNTGLLQSLFPEWRGIVCLVVPDFYHRYTVDEHTLVAIETLAELAATKDPTRGHCAGILAEIEDLALLRFALLFHDAGKGSHSGGHARRSMELARTAMHRIQMPSADRGEVEFLIEHHLDLSAVMNSRDLNDPVTARSLAQGIGTLERLKLLAVMTYADISAVHPGAMTPWRLEQLWQTYRVAHEELVRELETDRIRELPENLPGVAAFIKGFPTRYLRTHTPEEIQAHIQLKDLSRPTGAAVEIDRQGSVYRATVVARDMPALFASLAGALSSFGMDILKAEAFANSQGLILDTFVFADPKRTLDLNSPEIERLQQTLERAALGKLNVDQLLKSRPVPQKTKRRTQPSVHFDSEACETATLIEIITDDRPGLLYDLAATFSASGCNIDVVLIDTEGHKAIDVFYVASDGRKLTPPLEHMLSKQLLAVC
ncbi:MAG TPA: HD domain-containing protein [Bryobacteraceae bacterium]|nr:HD domain-containing protein [Bryobacteraceae bacterium]